MKNLSILGHWPKGVGPKPLRELRLVHKRGLSRQNSKNGIAVAMALRRNGTTQAEIKRVIGKPNLNKFRGLVASKICRSVLKLNRGDLKVYKLDIR